MSELNANQGFDYTDYSTGYDYGNVDDLGTPVGYSSFESSPVETISGVRNLGAVMSLEVVNKSFLFMMIGLFITAGAALTTSPELGIRMLSGYNYLILILIEFGVVMAGNAAVQKNNAIFAGVCFAIYSYMTGMILSVMFLIFTASSMASTFFVCAAMFGIMAVIGMVTGKDLTSFGNICLMGLLGILLTTAVNGMFLHSSSLELGIDVLAILVFCGLTAYDADKIKRIAMRAGEEQVLALSLYGAFELYLDFINIFIRLLRIMGKRK